MRLAVLAGNKLLPLLFIQEAKKNKEVEEIIAIGFRKETSSLIEKLADKTYWLKVGELSKLVKILKKEKIKDCVMVGQISPFRIFKSRKSWDSIMQNIAESTDWRPHSIFYAIINFLEREGFYFLDSTIFIKNYLAEEGLMNNVDVDKNLKEDIRFGVKIASRFTELDIGQTIVVKNKAVVAVEAIEGTDNTIKRAYKIAGKDLVVIKFAKKEQDLRFDVPVVGVLTLKVLERKAKALVLEKDKVIILEKERFLKEAEKYNIAIIGEERYN